MLLLLSSPFFTQKELLSGCNEVSPGQEEEKCWAGMVCHAQRWRSSLDEHQLECTFTCWQGVRAIIEVQKVGRHETKCQTDGLC